MFMALPSETCPSAFRKIESSKPLW